MWAHYADSISGVCLCFDKTKLIEENREIFGTNLELQEVLYATNFQPYLPQDTAKEFLRINQNNIFFLKDESWKNESEVRLLLTNINPNADEPMISIANSLEAIVFSQKFWIKNKNQFIDEILRPNSFLGSMSPQKWLLLIRNHVAYDIGPGFPLEFEQELQKTRMLHEEKAKDVDSYVKSLQTKYHMFEC
jgi:hypothetical protein